MDGRRAEARVPWALLGLSGTACERDGTIEARGSCWEFAAGTRRAWLAGRARLKADKAQSAESGGEGRPANVGRCCCRVRPGDVAQNRAGKKGESGWFVWCVRWSSLLCVVRQFRRFIFPFENFEKVNCYRGFSSNCVHSIRLEIVWRVINDNSNGNG